MIDRVPIVRVPYRWGQTIDVLPLADIHAGSAYCDGEAFRAHLKRHKSALKIGVGDFFDAIIASDAKRYIKSGDATKGASILDEQEDMLYEWLKPYRKTILGLGSGNHENEILKRCSTNLMQRLCNRLKVPFLGYSWFFKLQLHDHDARVRTVVIKGHHGFGGACRSAGGNRTKFEKEAATWSADILLYGHVHDSDAFYLPRQMVIGDRIVSRRKLVVLPGTYQETYSRTVDPSWAETKAFKPVDVGGPVIHIKPNANSFDYWADVR